VTEPRSAAPAAVVAVVPLRDGVSGKSRLATALEPAARRRLVAALARHVVTTLAATPQVAEILVVTADVGFVEEALAGLPLTVLRQPAERPGLNAALDHAREDVRRRRPGSTLLVAHADLPLLTPADVAALLRGTTGAALHRGTRAAVPHRGATGEALHRGDADPALHHGDTAAAVLPCAVVVATDRHDAGTNLLALPADAAFAFRFGADSKGAHVAEAARRGLPCVVVHRPGTAADLDTLDDWSELPAAVRLRLSR